MRTHQWFKVTISALVAFLAFPNPVQAATTKRIVTDCCELRAPSYLRFGSDGNASYDGLTVSVYSMSTQSSINATDEVVDSMGGGSVTYETSSSRWAVRSGLLSGTDTGYYIRAEYDRGCGEAGVLQITFPKSKKAQFSAAITTMSKSFSADLCG